ncbi:BolA family transcriptional regulator [Candidatus Pelagibacter sp.]|nr:BolA family transcriptional regulator [Candidatus Pelagibacter sp.]
MNINELIANVKKKLEENINIQSVLIEDKTFLHKNHVGHDHKKFHLKISVYSKELSALNKIESNKKIYKVLDHELKSHIHSLQILII